MCSKRRVRVLPERQMIGEKSGSVVAGSLSSFRHHLRLRRLGSERSRIRRESVCAVPAAPCCKSDKAVSYRNLGASDGIAAPYAYRRLVGSTCTRPLPARAMSLTSYDETLETKGRETSPFSWISGKQEGLKEARSGVHAASRSNGMRLSGASEPNKCGGKGEKAGSEGGERKGGEKTGKVGRNVEARQKIGRPAEGVKGRGMSYVLWNPMKPRCRYAPSKRCCSRSADGGRRPSVGLAPTFRERHGIARQFIALWRCNAWV